MKTIELEFDIGDKAYRVYNNKVVQCVVLQVEMVRSGNKEGAPLNCNIKYYVRHLDENAQTTWISESELAPTQGSLFRLIRLTGPEHDEEDLWDAMFGQQVIPSTPIIVKT